MTVIVQPNVDSNGNPQPMVYDSDTGKVIVDSNGYVLNGGQRLVNVPSVANYVSTPKTQTSGIQEAWNYALSNPTGYSTASSLYYILEIHYMPGAYDIYETVEINPPIYTFNGSQYTIGNIIMKGQGSMSPYFINHVTTDYMLKLVATSSSVINTNIEVDNLQFQNAVGVTAYGQLSVITPSGSNPFQSINLDVNGATTHPPVIVDGCNSIVLVNYELYMNQSSTYPASVFQTNGMFVAFGCTFNGDTIWAQNQVSILGSRINDTGSSEYAIQLNYVSTVYSNVPISQVLIDGCDTVFPIGINIDIGMLKINGSMLASTGSASALFQGISTTTYTIDEVRIEHSSVYGYSNGLALPQLASGVTVNKFTFTPIIGNTTQYSFILPEPSTPTVPASGTAQQNTNPYPVNVYVYGGDVTEIQITRNGTAYTVLSLSTAIAMSGQVYKLNPGDSITVTYSTAPDWVWVSD